MVVLNRHFIAFLPNFIYGLGIKLPGITMLALTLQLHLHGRWHDAMTISFDDPELGHASPCSFAYSAAYVVDHLQALGSSNAQAVSANIALGWDTYRTAQIPAFLLDIAPSGAARRFLLQRLAIPEGENTRSDLLLLQRCTPAPVGHLRIKESAEAMAQAPVIGFSRAEVIARDSRFLEYAYEQGAAIGGATGAGGEAPKLLLAEDEQGELYPDATLPDEQVARHWFVKFARNNARETDCTILRSEYCYYQALNELRIDTINPIGLALEEGRKPSLWMPRFDRAIEKGRVKRIAVESVYSLAGVTRPGSYMSHVEAAGALANAWIAAGQPQQVAALLSDYLRRDLINQILGNSDNHGRNTAILRDERHLELAPIYDLAPMVMDDEGITRTSKWPSPIEAGGQVDWQAACRSLAQWADAQVLFEGLRNDAQRLRALPDVLSRLNLPQQTFNHPRVYLRDLDNTLQRWGLI
jgi:serine/threonine-protein kinase HipA